MENNLITPDFIQISAQDAHIVFSTLGKLPGSECFLAMTILNNSFNAARVAQSIKPIIQNSDESKTGCKGNCPEGECQCVDKGGKVDTSA